MIFLILGHIDENIKSPNQVTFCSNKRDKINKILDKQYL